MIQIFINNMLNNLGNKPVIGAVLGSLTYVLGLIIPIEQDARDTITWVLSNCAFIVTVFVGIVTLYAKLIHKQKSKKNEKY